MWLHFSTGGAVWSCCRGGEPDLSLRPKSVCCHIHHKQLWHAYVQGGLVEEAVFGAFTLFAFEAEREPFANDSMMCNVDDTMCCRLFGVNWLSKLDGFKCRVNKKQTDCGHKVEVFLVRAKMQNACQLPEAVVLSLVTDTYYTKRDKNKRTHLQSTGGSGRSNWALWNQSKYNLNLPFEI